MALSTLNSVLLLCAIVPPTLTLSAPKALQDVIIKTAKTGKEQVAMVLIPGPGVKPSQYVPVGRAIQAVSEYSLWIGIPEFPLDVVLELEIGKGISRVLLEMQANGMDSNASVFLAAHSPFSAIPLQSYLVKNTTLARAQILFGSFLQRKYRDTPYPVKTLTVGGELDGVCRVTRIMEEFYHRVEQGPGDFNFPVVVIHGMSHSQYVSGVAPKQIKDGDLRPEISEDTAHAKVATIVSAYISVTFGDNSQIPTLQKAINDTRQFIEPLIQAYMLESSYKFKTPCFENPPSPSCQIGSLWTPTAMVWMAELDEGHVNDEDEIHPASEIVPKIHHPAIFTNCSKPSQSCIVKLSSVSENVYHEDLFDDGKVANSANEIRAKLKSRQSVMIAAGYGNVDFNKSDAGSRCKTINQNAYNWALGNTNPTTLSRFKEYGVAMVMGEDKGCHENGGLWIYLPMTYNTTTNSTGGEILLLQSIQLKTPITYSIGLFAGMHYCKLLSPARAMEWIYVDGLRRYYSAK